MREVRGRAEGCNGWEREMRSDQKALGCCEFLFKRLQGCGILYRYRCNWEALVKSLMLLVAKNCYRLEFVRISNLFLILFCLLFASSPLKKNPVNGDRTVSFALFGLCTSCVRSQCCTVLNVSTGHIFSRYIPRPLRQSCQRPPSHRFPWGKLENDAKSDPFLRLVIDGSHIHV